MPVSVGQLALPNDGHQKDATKAQNDGYLGSRMRILLIALVSSCLTYAQQPELQYRLRAPRNWNFWVLSPSASEAISNYTFSDDKNGRLIIDEKIRKGLCVTYKPGDQAIFIEDSSLGDAWHVKIVDGENRGREGWIHYNLSGEMMKDSNPPLVSHDSNPPLVSPKPAEVDAQHSDGAYAIPPRSKLYVQPMSGLGTTVMTAIRKRNLPLSIVSDRKDARFEISSDAHTLSVTNIETGVVLFSYSTEKRNAAEVCAKALASLVNQKHKRESRANVPDVPVQGDIVAGCVRVYDIYARSTSYLFGERPHLEMKASNDCDVPVSVFVVVGYYDDSDTQFNSKTETATIAPHHPGFVIVHVLDCADTYLRPSYPDGSCTVLQWRTRMKVMQVKSFQL